MNVGGWLIMSSTFCIRPWTHSCVRTNGDITLCCQSREISAHNLKTHTLQDWWSSDLLRDTRDQMINNRRPDACRECFNAEDQGYDSLRKKSNKDYKIIEKYASKIVEHYGYPREEPVTAEFQLTNLCNYRCLMCDENNSSNILSENKILKISNKSLNDFAITKHEISEIKKWMLSKPTRINFRGGEPLMVPEIKKILKWAVEKDLATDINLEITTNGSIFDLEWYNIFSKFKTVRIMLSVESTGKLNEYIRFGSKWEIIDSNAKQMSQLPNVEFIVHSTVQNLNIMKFTELINWCSKNNYSLDYEFLTGPVIYIPNNLPKPLLDTAINNLKSLQNPLADSIIKKLKPSDLTYWENFCEEIRLRESSRNNSIIDIIPELIPYIHAKTT